MKAAVLAETPNQTVALTTALLGAGGYGKTTLANALCRDDDVRFEFSDGILRVEIGKERNDVTSLVADLIEKLDPDGRRPGFADVVTASEHLGELLGESRILLVIDDVWREAQLKPFLRGGPNCVRLVTTRLPRRPPRWERVSRDRRDAGGGGSRRVERSSAGRGPAQGPRSGSPPWRNVLASGRRCWPSRMAGCVTAGGAR